MALISSPARVEGTAAVQPSSLEGKVLIVDDEASVRKVLHTTVMGLGFDIGGAASGEEAIELCQIID